MGLLSLGWRLAPEVARRLKRGHVRRRHWPRAPDTTHLVVPEALLKGRKPMLEACRATNNPWRSMT